MTTIIPWHKHLHHHLLKEEKSRDFHKIILDIYDTLDTDDKNKYCENFNSLITSWHYQPHEQWRTIDGIWCRFNYFLNRNFSDTTKYCKIVKIFNDEK